jgi:hypothetical protein
MKKLFTLTTISSCLALSMSAFAAGSIPTPNAPSLAQINMIQQLKALNTNVQVVGNRMQSIAEANAKSQNSGTPDQSILKSMIANPAVAKNKDANNESINELTNTDIKNQMQSFPENLVQTGSGLINSDQIQKDLQDDANTQNDLTSKVVASDSIYSNDPTVLALVPEYKNQLPARGLTPPKAADLQDNYFNFGSLIQPTVYEPNTDQGTAAQMFITYLTKSYNKPSDVIKFDSFQQKLAESQDATDKISLYMQLLNDKNYRNYQLSARSSTAARSVAINNFEKIIAERTPIKDLGTKAGLKDKDGKPIADASPLQVESYLANRRVDNPAWYAHVSAASPANVQRETLIVLAEIEAQNFQAHMDRERMLATLSAQSALGSAMSAQMLASQAQNLNQDIDKFTVPSQKVQDEQMQQKQGS